MRVFFECSTCKFWNGDKEARGASAYGRCRRYPPVHIPSSRGTDYSEFPNTNGSDWCGEHLIQETTKSDEVAK